MRTAPVTDTYSKEIRQKVQDAVDDFRGMPLSTADVKELTRLGDTSVRHVLRLLCEEGRLGRRPNPEINGGYLYFSVQNQEEVA